ncbi:hypothetical protein F4813DRAFT_55839 [Daldinia decipiens]|uniref:uncharacterized protein n=1 Tax=Daldinia decipiens TaxID=326647 RepID=UPI0020C31F5F|nr:uncharacterized protein F4813DRAFT_55839 [Daldinia decipiens]KAI1658164.1 hypothetical protein F4813DRAFT_55839 [Daldinia decipiens]
MKMSSKRAKERRLIAPPEVDNVTKTGTEANILDEHRWKRKRRNANVYDAVAGRVTTTLPLDDGSESEIPSHHSRTSRDHRRDPTLAPEEVLFRRIRAPVRYAEKDIYHAHEELQGGGRGTLPDSDMLKAVHSYSSHFYAALAMTRGEPDARTIDEQSMDETALLAFGILLEEASRSALGRTGDLVFTEGVATEQDGEPEDGDDDDDDDDETVGFKASIMGP